MRNVCLVKASLYSIADFHSGLKLANLHSMAVDYVKTGQPAYMSRDLKPLKWPHFMEKVGKQQHQIYTSKKVLGQLYDQVERVDFVPAFAAPFDTRILQAYTLDESILQSAREIKEEYDAHMRRIMAQQEIKTEFEVWSTFVLQHSSTSNSFKYHEQIGEISMALKDHFRLLCHERAGGKDYEHIGPFVAAMYKVTAREVSAAVEECHRSQMIGGQQKPLREMTPSTMPLMSFPWIFQDILGKIAKNNACKNVDTLSIREQIDLEPSVQLVGIEAPQPKRGRMGPSTLDPGDYLKTSKGTTYPGELLELFQQSSESYECKGKAEVEYIPSSSASIISCDTSRDMSVECNSPANDGLTDNSSSSPKLPARNTYQQCSYNHEAPAKHAAHSTISLESHLPGSENTLHGQWRTEVVKSVKKEKPTALENVSLEPDDKRSEGYNPRRLKALMVDRSARPNKPGDLPFHSEEESGLKNVSFAEVEAAKTSQLSRVPSGDNVDKGIDTEISMEKNNNKANEEVGYSDDSDTESDEVVLYNDKQVRLLDQLAAIAEMQERD